MSTNHTVLSGSSWRAREAHHRRAVEIRVREHEERRRTATTHPVEDFLFTYYTYRPNQLRRWHPGGAVALADVGDDDRAGWPLYHERDGLISVDVDAFAAAKGPLLRFVRRLLRSTLRKSGQYNCFGLHEWAMVYRQPRDEVRHQSWPLRLDGPAIAQTVESRGVRCTHFDAFRFFTPAARPLNEHGLTRESQLEQEQPGCLHAGMDLYKWAYKLVPLVSSDLVLRCFDVARRIRYVDMQASPYDLADLGLAPIRIETPAGRAEYAALQRELSEAAAPLRRELLDACEAGSTREPAASRVGGRD